jgi:hypothetical protein
MGSLSLCERVRVRQVSGSLKYVPLHPPLSQRERGKAGSILMWKRTFTPDW